MPDPLGVLLPFKWRDVEVPVTRMRLGLAHDLVEHKYWGVDGGQIEDTGVAPLRISATIPLFNGTLRGVKERWDPELYPRVMRQFMAAFARRETGVLQHPEFGALKCKAERLDMEWSADHRGGTSAEASWVETSDLAQAVTKAPETSAATAAADLDAQQRDIKALVPKMPEFEETFESALNKIAGGFDQLALTSNRALGRIDAVVYRVKQVEDSIGRAKSALTWPMAHAADALKSAAFDLRQKLRDIEKDIVLYRVPGDTTLAGLAAQLPDSRMTDLIQLNPHLMQAPVVPRDATVRYYVPRIAA